MKLCASQVRVWVCVCVFVFCPPYYQRQIRGKNFKRINSPAYSTSTRFMFYNNKLLKWSTVDQFAWGLGRCVCFTSWLKSKVSQSDTNIRNVYTVIAAVGAAAAAAKNEHKHWNHYWVFTVLRMLYNNKLHQPYIGANVSSDQEGSQAASQPTSVELNSNTCALAHTTSSWAAAFF